MAEWWRSLPDEDECPISLESLSCLPYPPFQLGKKYYDALTMASYVVSRARFENPLTRGSLTLDDCRALDEHLERHVYDRKQSDDEIRRDHEASLSSLSSERFSVLEAFTLWNSVNVRLSKKTSTASTVTSTTTTNRDADDDSRRRRADALRREATLALRRLFVFGRRDSARATTSNVWLRERTLHVGFDLNRMSPLMISANDESALDVDAAIRRTAGLTMVDENAHIATLADHAVWDELQRSFPPLSSPSSSRRRPEASPRAVNGDSVVADGEATTTADLMSEKLRETARRALEEEKVHRERAEKYKLFRSARAKSRCEERLRIKRETWDRMKEERIERETENAEIDAAREEISRWREEQWKRILVLNEKSRLESIKKQVEQKTDPRLGKTEDEVAVATCQHVSAKDDSTTSETTGTDNHNIQINECVEEEEEAKRLKVEKKAAKRRREKERKKAKKAAEKERIASEITKKELQKEKREASSFKCANCGTGILKLKNSFEKSGKYFCTTACARAGSSIT